MIDELNAGVGKFNVSLNGQNAIYIFLLALSLGCSGYMVWGIIEYSRDQNISEHESIRRGLEELVYIQTLSENERKSLNLTMPESLRIRRSR